MKTKFLPIFLLILLIFSFLYYNIYFKQNDAVFSQYNVFENMKNNFSLKVMTYNIQHGVGVDGNLNIDRTAEVIKSSQADIIGLNEVDTRMLRSNFQNQLKIFSERLNMNYVYGPTLNRLIGSYGNGILTKYPVNKIKNHKLPGNSEREPRGLLEAQISVSPSFQLKVLVTHLSLVKEDRIRQWEWILNYINSKTGPFLLMGDFNFQNNISRDLKYFLATDKTYPAGAPVKEIDMFFSNKFNKDKIYTIKSNASDHLPLVLELSYDNS